MLKDFALNISLISQYIFMKYFTIAVKYKTIYLIWSVYVDWNCER